MKAILNRVLRPPASPAQNEPAPAGRRGPALEPTPLDEITRIGRAMYGERWIASIAKDAGEHVRQVQRWRAGTSQPSPRALAAIRQAARRHITRIARALGEEPV